MTIAERLHERMEQCRKLSKAQRAAFGDLAREAEDRHDTIKESGDAAAGARSGLYACAAYCRRMAKEGKVDKADLKKAMRTGLLVKAHVAAHLRRTPTGGTAQVREHETRRPHGYREIDHAAYQKKVRSMTDSELRFTIKNANEAMAAMPDGPKAGYYADEVNYCSKELHRRQQAKASGRGKLKKSRRFLVL